MKKDLMYYISDENVLPSLTKMIAAVNDNPLLVIYQRYETDYKTIKDYIIGTVLSGEIVNERSGEGIPMLFQKELEYPVLCIYGLPYCGNLN